VSTSPSTKVRLEQPLVHLPAEPVLVGEVGEPVRVECVYRHRLVQGVGQPFRGGQVAHLPM